MIAPGRCNYGYSRQGRSPGKRVTMECECLIEEARVCTLRMEAMHVTDWEVVQHEDPLLATCLKWMCDKKAINE